jgi:hypothetical protein
MEVTGAEECEYAEAIFRSSMPKRYDILEGPAMNLSGTIYVYQKSEDNPALFYKYTYGEANLIDAEVASVVEVIPWELYSFHKVTVKRDRVWFDGEVRPRIKKFWEDVQLALNGKFTVPDAKKRKRKEDACLISVEESQVYILPEQALETEQNMNQDIRA